MEGRRFLDLYVFGDQTCDIQVKDLRSLMHDGRADPVVVEFLDRARQALQDGLCQLDAEDRRQVPSFACTMDLLLWSKGHCMAVDMAILCLYQLGSFMRYVAYFCIISDGIRAKYAQQTEKTTGQLTQWAHWALLFHRQVGYTYPSPENSCCLGLCTGALAAAAVSSSRNTLELLPLAIEAVRLAFRIGMLVDTMARCIEPWSNSTHDCGEMRDNLPGNNAGRDAQKVAVHAKRLPWTFLVKDSDVDAALRKFNEDCNLPFTARVWISARSIGDTVAVSGRPSSLARFLQWRQPQLRHSQPLQIFAPYHAPHLYSRDDVEQLLPPSNISDGPSGTSVASVARLRIPLILSTTGNIVQPSQEHAGFRALLILAAEQILLGAIGWDPLLAALKSKLQTLGDNTVLRVFTVATTVDRLIYNSLQQQSPSASLSGGAFESNDIRCKSPSGSKSPFDREKVAIVGMAGRFPEAPTTDDLWDILRLGIDVCKEVPPLRWNAKTHVDPSGRKKNTSRTSLGCWLNDPDVFDAQFFGISAQEATLMDPAQRLALMTTYEAIEQAGIVWQRGTDDADDVPSSRPDCVGVYCGVAGNDWRDCNAAQNVDSHFMRASNRAFVSGRISDFFKLGGPSVTVDTSSSGSLAPVHMACRSLCARETDTCIVVGAHIMTNPDTHAGFDRASALSHSGNCKIFDETAIGFCRGEGVATLVLKRFEDALSEHDTILGVIAGVATNYNLRPPPGHSKPAHGASQKTLFTEVFNKSNVDPASISYVEMGGPHTNAEDLHQVAEALDVLAPKSTSGFAAKGRATPVYVGSATVNIGHGEATSGLSSIIKVLLMLREAIIPPNIGTPTEPTSETPGGLLSTGKFIKWVHRGESPRDERRRALILDKGTIAPASSALILEERPVQTAGRHDFLPKGHGQLGNDPCSGYLVAVSAKTKTSLRRNMANLHAWLRNEATRCQFSLAQISYTTTARRSHYAHRTVFVTSSVEDACTQICARLQQSRIPLVSNPTGPGSAVTCNHLKSTRPIVFAFGNRSSSTSVNYFRQLYDSFSQVRRDTNHLDQILRILDLPSVIDALRLTGSGERGPHERSETPRPLDGLVPNQLDPLVTTCVQIVISRLWRSWGINPVAIVTEGGSDVYSALNVAGVLSDADALYLASTHFRLGLLKKRKHGSSGHVDDWSAVVTAELERLNSAISYHEAELPVLTLITAQSDERSAAPCLDVLAAKDEKSQILLMRHFLSDSKRMCSEDNSSSASATQGDLVAACRASEAIQDQSIIHFMGPEAPRVLGATLDCSGDASSLSGDERTWNTTEGGNNPQDQSKVQMWSHLTESLCLFYHQGVNIRWDQYHIDLPPGGRRVVSTLPAYSWDLKEYWLPYVNDWTLLKGGASKSIVAPKLESTTIHRIVEETELLEDGANKLQLVVEADISRDDLHGIVQGHVVDDVPLCTPSVYSDIALSLGKYLQQRYYHGHQERLVNIKDMTVTKALIAQPTGPQMLRAHVEADWDSNSATCKFSTVDRHNKPQQHAQCTITFSDSEIMEHIEQFDMAGSYSKLVRALRQGIAAHRTVRFTRNMMYRMISSLADFHPDHKLVEDIVLDSQTHEATALVSFGQLLDGDGKHSGTFHTHPGVVDALTQPAGFALNGSDSTDLDREVYINHGWGSFSLFGPLELTKAYTVYVHMNEGKDNIWYGDIVVLDMSDESAPRVVALFEKYSVQRMPRRVLSIVLRAEGGGAYKSARGQSGQGLQHRLDQRQVPLPKPMQQETSSSSSTLVSPAEKQVQAAHNSPTTNFGLREKRKQTLQIKVGVTAPTTGPRTPLTAKALSLNNDMMSSLRVRRDGRDGVEQRLLQIISEESGYDLSDVDDDKLALVDIGIDPLLSSAIISRFREELGDSLSHLDLNTLFTTCPTVASIKAALFGNRPTQDPRNVREWRATSTNTASIPLSPPDSARTQDMSLLPGSSINSCQVPQATSIILQGTLKKARATLFLFPDGSGSATSYASIPPISRAGDVCVIAFNCPFLKKESSMLSCSLDALINQGYLPELHRRLGLWTAIGSNINRTYYVGGWSAGGTLAYHAAQRLFQQEDDTMHSPKSLSTLAGLILIDAPPPIRGMDPLPNHFFEYCERKGVFGGWSGPQAHKAPDWLIPHFNGTIAILQHYVAEPLTRTQSARLKTVACIWAGESVVGSDKPLEPHPDDTEGMKFLTVQRTDFSTAGWERLVPGVDASAILCERLEGAHHFSLTRSPHVSKLAEFIRQAMSLG